MRAHDGRGPQTLLTYEILNMLRLSSPDELIGYSSSLSIGNLIAYESQPKALHIRILCSVWLLETDRYIMFPL